MTIKTKMISNLWILYAPAIAGGRWPVLTFNISSVELQDYLLVFYMLEILTGQNGNRNSKRRIVVVDDNLDITLTLKAGLEASGPFEVHTFNDPELALSFFNPYMFDLALFDMRMPKTYVFFPKTSFISHAWQPLSYSSKR